MLAELCMKEQILARNSGRPWPHSGTHSVSVEGLRRAGSCSCAPAVQQDRLAAPWGTSGQARCKTKMCMGTSKKEGSVNHYCAVQIKTHQTSLLELFQLIDMNLIIRLTNIFS